MGLREVLQNGWTKLCRFCFRLFFIKPIKLGRNYGLQYPYLKAFYWYLTLFAIVLWGIPAMGLAVWYLTILKGCQYAAVRSLVADVCLGAYLNHHHEDPWHLKLWDPRTTNSSGLDSLPPLPLWAERIMTSRIRLQDTALALNDQLSKTQSLAHGFTTAQIIDDLERIQAEVLAYLPHFETFSRSFCEEKDNLNYAFRVFVNVYARAITSKHSEFSLLRSLLNPAWEHTLPFLNIYFQFPWLPEQKLYSIQVRSELRFQGNQMIDESVTALDRIEAGISTIPTNRSASLVQFLERASQIVRLHQDAIRRAIDSDRNVSSFWQYLQIGISEDLRTLRESDARGERILGRLSELRDALGAFAVDHQKLKEELRYLRTSFRQAPSFEFSSEGLIAVPVGLLSQSQGQIDHRFSWLRPSWNHDFQTGDAHLQSIPPGFEEYQYNLDEINKVNISSLQSEIAYICKERINVDMVSGTLHMICKIWSYAMAFSELDDGLLSGYQRSWIRERIYAVRRFEKEIGAEYVHIARLMEKAAIAYAYGTPVPEFLH